MVDTRQITDLTLATVVNDGDNMGIVRQGGVDFRYTAELVREPLLRKSNNLSDVDDAATARQNLGVDTSDFLEVDENLADVPDPAQARSNLGINLADYLEKAANLNDLTDVAAARANLGLSFSDVLLAADNLSDVNDVPTARTNLNVTSADITAVTDATNQFNFNKQNQPQLEDYTETFFDNGNISGTASFDLTNGNVQRANVDGDVDIDIIGAAGSLQANGLSLVLTNGGDFAVTWNSSIVWNDGTAPDLTSGGTDILTFFTVDQGTTWYGFIAGKNMS